MASPINRREHKDIPKQILLTWDLCKRSEARADELDVSYSRYIRDLITDDLKRAKVQKLSQANQANNSGTPVEVLDMLTGLLTNPKAMELLKLLTDQKTRK